MFSQSSGCVESFQFTPREIDSSPLPFCPCLLPRPLSRVSSPVLWFSSLIDIPAPVVSENAFFTSHVVSYRGAICSGLSLLPLMWLLFYCHLCTSHFTMLSPVYRALCPANGLSPSGESREIRIHPAYGASLIIIHVVVPGLFYSLRSSKTRQYEF